MAKSQDVTLRLKDLVGYMAISTNENIGIFTGSCEYKRKVHYLCGTPKSTNKYQ